MKGWKQVFSFTFGQNIKGKSSKLALFGIAALVFAIFFAIPMIIGAASEEDEKEPEEKPNAYEVSTVYLINHSGLSDISFQEFATENQGLKDIKIVEKTETPDALLESISSEDKTIVIAIERYRYLEEQDVSVLWDDKTDKLETLEGELEYRFTVYAKEGFYDDEEHQRDAQEVAYAISEYFDAEKYKVLGIAEETNVILSMPVDYVVNEIGELGQGIGEMLAKLLIPMMTTLVIYMLVLLYGQSISKIIVVEKSSKLMEMLLISVQPYAIVFGKILGMFTVAILQFATWILSGTAGYMIGTKVADTVFTNYADPMKGLIELLRQDAESAFSVPAVILGLVILVFGFFMYCVLAAMSSAIIKKAEDVSNGSAIYQAVVVVAFLAGYMLPLTEISDTILNVVRLIPIVGAFMLPADLIVGNCTLLIGSLGLLTMALTTVILIYFTGKLYKKKIF